MARNYVYVTGDVTNVSKIGGVTPVEVVRNTFHRSRLHGLDLLLHATEFRLRASLKTQHFSYLPRGHIFSWDRRVTWTILRLAVLLSYTHLTMILLINESNLQLLSCLHFCQGPRSRYDRDSIECCLTPDEMYSMVLLTFCDFGLNDNCIALASTKITSVARIKASEP
jgi:hypothetical protein